VATELHTLSTEKPIIKPHLAVDILGPFPVDDSGNTTNYVISIIDCFSRYVELYPAADAVAAAATQAVVTHHWLWALWIARRHSIRSDNSPQYANDLIERLVLPTGVSFDKTTPYSHEENGLVERSHSEVLRHLRAILVYERTCIKLMLERLLGEKKQCFFASMDLITGHTSRPPSLQKRAPTGHSKTILAPTSGKEHPCDSRSLPPTSTRSRWLA
jgi:hypothetical protein